MMSDAEERLTGDVWDALARAESDGLSLSEQISALELIVMALREQEDEND
jgi:hypothetical protein